MRERTWIDVLMEAPWGRLLEAKTERDYDNRYTKNIYGPIIAGDVIDDALVTWSFHLDEVPTVLTREQLGEKLVVLFVNRVITETTIKEDFIAADRVILYELHKPQPEITLTNVRIGIKKRYVRYDKCNLDFRHKNLANEMIDYNPLRVEFFKNPVDRIHYVTSYYDAGL